MSVLDEVPFGEDALPVGWPQDHGIASAGPNVLAWAEHTLVQPDGDNAGEPWSWTESQARFVSWWYALDGAGRFLWRRGQVCLPKGAGKSPLMAALADVELAGPVVFDGWDSDGTPRMKPHASPDVKLSALSLGQAMDATMNLSVAMLDNPVAAKTITGLDTGLTRIRTKRGMLSPATSQAPSKEGPRLSAVILDESNLWVESNGGHRLAATLRRNLAKTGGRSLEACNMWPLGTRSVAEQTAEYAAQVDSGVLSGDGVLRWHPVGECDDLADLGQLRTALCGLYFDSPWIDVDRLIAEIMDGDTHPADARRYYLNQPASANDAWLRADRWEACKDRDKRIEDKDVIVLGFDGSRGRVRGNADATALIGCRVKDGHLFEVGVWQGDRDDVDWEPPETEVDAAVEDAFRRYRVVGMYADPAYWEARVSDWERRFGPKLKVGTGTHPMRWSTARLSQVVQACASFEDAVNQGDLTHDGTFRLTQHVLNGRRIVLGRSGLGIGKEHKDSPNKIDAAYAAVIAWQARLDALAKGATGVAVGRGRVIALD